MGVKLDHKIDDRPPLCYPTRPDRILGPSAVSLYLSGGQTGVARQWRITVDVLGIDVAKRDLHATLLQNDRVASKSVPNSESGIAQLQTWLKNRNANRVHACLEATGGWSEQVAILIRRGRTCRQYRQPSAYQGVRAKRNGAQKTDRIDAALIARFCRLHQPEPWKPPAPEIRILQGLVRRQHSLI